MNAPFQIHMPELHAGQVEAFKMPGRFRAGRCGRRFGKTEFAQTIIEDGTIRGKAIGYFAPSYKLLSEVFVSVRHVLHPLIEVSNQTSGVIRLITGGRADFWSLENKAAGRSRKYDTVIIDEAAFTPNYMLKTWEGAIRPTLLDYRGNAWVFSTPNGVDTDNFFWRICNDPKFEFNTFHAPTWKNPYIPADEIEKLRKSLHPLFFRQEIEAEFIDWRGVAFFSIDNFLVNGKPVPYPFLCDFVYAVIDTGMKSGKEHDGTAVTYYASSWLLGVGHPLVILDWDILSIDGAMLEGWLPSVFTRLEELSKKCGAMNRKIAAFIEDKGSGTVLIQQAQNNGLPAQPIEGKLTSIGKDERAMNVSGYVWSHKVKISEEAFYKETDFKDQFQNHFVHQVTGFRVGDKDAKDRADDLLDTFTYGVSIGCGNMEGF
jgi:hypothetical protein